MYNSYGERSLVCVRVPLAGIEASVRTGAVTPAQTCEAGVPADAVLVDARLWAAGTDEPPSAILLVFESAEHPVVLAGMQIPEVALTMTGAPAQPTPAE